jgi:hypothetical protein
MCLFFQQKFRSFFLQKTIIFNSVVSSKFIIYNKLKIKYKLFYFHKLKANIF